MLLTSPVSQDPLRTVAGITTPALGLAYLATVAEQAGCTQLFLGFESASQAVLDSLCKGVRVEQAWETMSVLRRAGIDCVGSFILGCPADTRATIRATIRMARKLAPAYAQFTLLTPIRAWSSTNRPGPPACSPRRTGPTSP